MGGGASQRWGLFWGGVARAHPYPPTLSGSWSGIGGIGGNVEACPTFGPTNPDFLEPCTSRTRPNCRDESNTSFALDPTTLRPHSAPPHPPPNTRGLDQSSTLSHRTTSALCTTSSTHFLLPFRVSGQK